MGWGGWRRGFPGRFGLYAFQLADAERDGDVYVSDTAPHGNASGNSVAKRGLIAGMGKWLMGWGLRIGGLDAVGAGGGACSANCQNVSVAIKKTV
jgi:hypothetical protein